MFQTKQSARSFVAFLVAWSFVILTITGLVLYIVPQGRIAYWVHWSLLGLPKEDWGHIHLIFGGLFIAAGILHLYYNWKPFKHFLASRVAGRLQMSRESVAAGLVAILVITSAILAVPPVSWVLDLNHTLKESWVTGPELEPPFGHAEELSLAGFGRRMNLDVKKSIDALRANGMEFSPEDSLDSIARANGTTPMVIYGMIRGFER
ncbi:MAG: DUF4405 domain-containing protein, partial [Pseudomonadota bacterium]